ncbi:CHASE2 domain-containing protein [Nostocaceae cyanobacterium CENA357]|uniref:non-specific serine/threonine protein kinase n=1 Tax=Atlanticothrix silvestris CENA357 TaxID=1725252 RepID=A0A8J7HLA1_9CYAN|nr:CHASE2 domain-containing serine/threonine-protein kinase [Atlanticothrix silvestris]MBH8554838.1 CHASE2 domain-containing protein [Atlanticothrix silvestris CENA357]
MISGILEKLRAALAKYQGYGDSPANKNWWQIILFTSLGVTTLIWGVRELKELQSWELKAYDQMLRSRPIEPPDPRILLVTITEEDLARQKWPLPDATINQLLLKLESYQPRIIALNLYRPEQKNLAADLKNQKNIISTCLLSSIGRSEVPPPPNFNQDNIGYSDLIPDNHEDQIVRRGLLFAHSTDNKCTTSFSFAALAAVSYLEKQGLEIDFPDTDNFYVGKINFPTLKTNSGSYKGLDAAGYQILLNYRQSDRLAQQVTLTQVLSNQLNPNWVKDRLVIIGITAASLHPGLYTPYSASPEQPARTPAVLIHAQIASQLLSTVIDGRPQLWYWPDWAELVWVWSWSIVGSILGWRFRHPLLLLVVGSITLASLVGICVGLFLLAGWIPLIPPAIALVISGVSVMAYTTYQTQQQTQVIILQVEQQKAAIEQLNILLKETTTTADSTTIRDLHVHDNSALTAPEKRTGDLLLGGRYQISQVLAAGGFGRTYLAKDTQRPGNPSCVVKQLMPARRDPRFLQVARRLFNTEAEILEALGKHEQIPALLAYFEDHQEFYLVQEYISGHTLGEELPPVQGLKSESFVIDMLKGVLEILVFVHEHRVIHRDIKPTNIIRSTQNHRLVLIDFGAVKLMQPPTSDQTELATVAIGTRGYAPPEQMAGHPRLSSDIYALGMMGIQAVTGIPPQELHPDSETGNIIWRETTSISEELAVILDKMVRYHFSDRYQSSTAVLQDLKRIVK